jgi:ribosomal 30S subunit maturation factor RimM
MLIHPEGIEVGKVQRPHGFKGAMVVHFNDNQPELYTNFPHFFFQMGADLVPFRVAKLSHRSDGRAYLELDDVKDEATAKSFSGKAILLSQAEFDQLPQQQDEDDDSYVDWVIVLSDGMVPIQLFRMWNRI